LFEGRVDVVDREGLKPASRHSRRHLCFLNPKQYGAGSTTSSIT
jgi:hypothetical protein